MNSKREKPRAYREITQALLDLMQEMDYHRITVEDILRRSTYSKTSFYKYFRNKENCFLSIINDEIREYISFFIRVFKELTKDNYSEIMYRMYCDFFDHILQKRILFEQLLLNESLRDFYSYFLIKTLEGTKQHFSLLKSDRYSELFFYQHIHGTFGIVECWILNGFDMTTEELGQYCTSYDMSIVNDIIITDGK